MEEKNKDKSFEQRREELLKSRLITDNGNQSSQYIESLIEDVVLNGVSFDKQLPIILSFAENEGLDANQLKNEIVVLIDILKSVSGQPSSSEKMAILYQAQICHISEKAILHILSDLEEKKEQEETEKRAHEKTEAEKLEKAGSLYKKGLTYFRNLDFKEAIPYLFESAMLGDSRAQATLSNCYGNGKGVDRSDTESFRWAMASAQQNNPMGQVQVGMFFLYGGESIKPNDEQAFSWIKKSADQNYPLGLYYLGQCYYCGVGVAPDTELAYWYFRKSSDLGFSTAKDILKGETWPLLTKDKLEEIRRKA